MAVDFAVSGMAGIGGHTNQPMPGLSVRLRRDQRPRNTLRHPRIRVAGTKSGDDKRMGVLKGQHEVIRHDDVFRSKAKGRSPVKDVYRR